MCSEFVVIDCDLCHGICISTSEMDELEEIMGRGRKRIPKPNPENRTAYIGETEDQTWLKKIPIQNANKVDMKDCEEIYSKLVHDMSVFYWQRPQYVNVLYISLSIYTL